MKTVERLAEVRDGKLVITDPRGTNLRFKKGLEIRVKTTALTRFALLARLARLAWWVLQCAQNWVANRHASIERVI